MEQSLTAIQTRQMNTLEQNNSTRSQAREIISVSRDRKISRQSTCSLRCNLTKNYQRIISMLAKTKQAKVLNLSSASKTSLKTKTIITFIEITKIQEDHPKRPTQPRKNCCHLNNCHKSRLKRDRYSSRMVALLKADTHQSRKSKMTS